MTDASTLLALAGAHLWQGLALAVVVFGGLALGRRMSGGMRYAIAASGFAAAILLPAAALVPGEGLVRWMVGALRAPVEMVNAGRIEGLPAAAPQRAGASLQTEAAVRASSGMVLPDAAPVAPPIELNEIAAGPGSVALSSPASTAPDMHAAQVPQQAWTMPRIELPELGGDVLRWMLLGWALVSLVLLVRLAGDVMAVERLVARARPVELRGALRARFGDVPVLASAEADGPMAAGLLRPSIILPNDAELLLARPGAAALLEHERAHVMRGDVHAALVQRLVLALLWWSPGLHWMSRRMDEEREVACDDDAVKATGDARSFALTLTEEAKMRLLRTAPRLAVGVIGSRSRFAARVRRLVDPANRGGDGRAAGRATLAALGLTVLLAGLLTPRIEASAQQAPPAPPAPPPAQAQAVPAPLPVPAPAPAPAPTEPPAPPRVVVMKDGELTPELKALVDRLKTDGAGGEGKSRIVAVQVQKGGADGDKADGDKHGAGDAKTHVFAFSADTGRTSDGTASGADGDKAGEPKVLSFRFRGAPGDGAALEGGALGDSAHAFAFDLSASVTEGVLKELPMILAQVGAQIDGSAMSEEIRKAIEEAVKELPGADGDATVSVDIAQALNEAKGSLGDSRMSIVIAREAMAVARKEMEAARDEAAKAAGEAGASADAAQKRTVILRSVGPEIRMVRAGSSATDGLNRALATTAQRGDEAAVKALLNAGADANGVVPGEDSALIQAVRAGDVATVRVLLDAGADPSKATSTGETPLAAAKATGKSSLERLLKARGAKE
jgi:beta-lactamase regulating signal transducer with metallopeptidase domain